MEFMVIAGEASGDAHAAELITALRRRHPDLRFFGCGGEAMAAAGCELLVHDRELAVMGLVEVVRHLPRLRRLLGVLRQALVTRRPHAIILVDFPDFNLRLAATAHAAGIPAVYFISPQVWAWRAGRVRQIQRHVRRMICIFPFEADFYARYGVEVASVGHPLVERIAAYRGANPPAPAGSNRVAVLPGSRQRELDFHFPVLLDAMRRLHARHGCSFVLPVAPHLHAERIRARVPSDLQPVLEVLPPGNMYPALAEARLALVASGTATVETALFGVPMVVFYRLSGLSYRLGRRLVRTPHVAMVNLIAGREVVPELVQGAFTGAALAAQAERLLDDGPERTAMLAGLAEVQSRLGPPGAIERAAA
ncbi:MAG: lipid-A-disaccharide synthase, partial [Terriglobales bacterium]